MRSMPWAFSVEVSTYDQTLLSTSFRAIARPIEPDTASPPVVEKAMAMAMPPASPRTSVRSVACRAAEPWLEVTSLLPVISLVMVCLTVLPVPTPVPANAPVVWGPAAP